MERRLEPTPRCSGTTRRPYDSQQHERNDLCFDLRIGQCSKDHLSADRTRRMDDDLSRETFSAMTFAISSPNSPKPKSRSRNTSSNLSRRSSSMALLTLETIFALLPSQFLN